MSWVRGNSAEQPKMSSILRKFRLIGGDSVGTTGEFLCPKCEMIVAQKRISPAGLSPLVGPVCVECRRNTGMGVIHRRPCRFIGPGTGVQGSFARNPRWVQLPLGPLSFLSDRCLSEWHVGHNTTRFPILLLSLSWSTWWTTRTST